MPSSATANFGFDSAFLQKLERLALLTHRPMAGPGAGPRRSPRHGASVEFADFRNYTAGDDFRRIDWNAFARLDRLFLRLYLAEEIAALTLFLDHSRSMQFGTPTKALTAARVAAVLSYIALRNYDTVSVAGWGERIDHYLPGQRGQAATAQVWRTIAGLVDSPVDATDFSSLRTFGNFTRRPGIAVVLSDFLTNTDWRSGLRSLRSAGQQVTAVQVLAPEEIEPSLRGDWKLVDAESGAETEVTISPRLLRRYHDELERHSQALQDFCRREGISFLQVRSDVDVGGSLLTGLRAAGILG